MEINDTKDAGREECDTEGMTKTISGNGGNTAMRLEVSRNLCTKQQSVGRSDVSMLANRNSGCHIIWPDTHVSE